VCNLAFGHYIIHCPPQTPAIPPQSRPQIQRKRHPLPSSNPCQEAAPTTTDGSWYHVVSHHSYKHQISGGPRHNLGCIEKENGMMERAMKHFIIAAKLGHDMSVNALKEIIKGRLMSKEDLDGVLYHKVAMAERGRAASEVQ